MGYKKILVAMDRPPETPEVFEQALELAKKEGAQLMVFHCVRGASVAEAVPPTITEPLAGSGLYPATGASIFPLGVGDLELLQLQQEQLGQEIEQDKQWLQTYCQNAIAQGVRAECAYKVGSPGVHICDLARNWQAELIVIGRRGLKGLKEILLGSISSYVIHHAPCSVLVVQGEYLS